MSSGDFLREWAISLRAIIELDPGATRITLEFGPGTSFSYERGVGLVCESAGHTMRVPEEALEEERWMVADAV